MSIRAVSQVLASHVRPDTIEAMHIVPYGTLPEQWLDNYRVLKPRRGELSAAFGGVTCFEQTAGARGRGFASGMAGLILAWAGRPFISEATLGGLVGVVG